jgi:hypothetical protein
LKIAAVACAALSAASSTAARADASQGDFRTQANRICKNVLGEIHDPPGNVTSPDQLTRRVGDRWLGSAGSAFAELPRKLAGLSPPLAALVAYRAMRSDFSAVSRAFVGAKQAFDRRDSVSLARHLSIAALWGGRAAKLAKRLGLSQCGP